MHDAAPLTGRRLHACMAPFNRLVNLLGKSERDRDVQAILAELGIAQPLIRPNSGEDQISFEVEGLPLELCFIIGDQLPARHFGWMEGELVLDSVFVLPKLPEIDEQFIRTLPFGLSQKMSRKEAKAKLGEPAWSSPILPNDRWLLSGLRVLVCFSEDEARIQQFSISMANCDEID